MTEISTEIFDIPEQNHAKLHAKIAQINKRADKIGVPHVEIVEHDVEYIPDAKAVGNIMDDLRKDPNVKFADNDALREMAESLAPKNKVYKISFAGEGPKIEGYTFVGSLDHQSIPGDVLIKTVPGESIPKSHYDAKPICDHCDKIRPRNNTYVLREDETGKHIQVGSHCVRDFIGYDPSQIARFLERVWNLIDDVQDEEWGGGSGYVTPYYNPIELLKTTNAVIRTYGWVSRGRADADGSIATSSYVMQIILPPYNEKDRQERRKLINEIEWNEEKDCAEAEAAIEWILSKEDDNEYIANLRKLAKAEAIPGAGVGMWISLMAAYQREQDRLREKARQHKKSEWVGEIKERRDFTAELVGRHTFDGAFGPVTLHRFLDEEGRSLTWFANTNSDMERGRTYTFTATIKKHDEYNDWKQTVLNRVKVKEDHGVVTTGEDNE